MKRVERQTRETTIRVGVALGNGPARIDVENEFLRHMLDTFARYAGLELELHARGDLHHHTVEDVAITLGLALKDLTPARATRYGWAAVPMDDAWVDAALDLGGRAWYGGTLPSRLYQHFLRSLAFAMDATLHVQVVRGFDRHHIVEAAIKATGLSLRQAIAEGDQLFSTKGAVEIRRTED
ncbi:MAG: imidazoleglycerol-phosphate dehydratase [Gemmatimonadota bacterium]|nr:imidazoleglycerol-phosphate dehydratase [Gemmatimonadota bacterium]